MTPLRGILPVLQTPFTAAGALDEDSLAREVALCVRGGAHGLTFPVLASEFQFLTDAERDAALRCVVRAAGGQLPVIAGVAAPSLAQAQPRARAAAEAGAQAVVALPPYVEKASRAQLFEYYAGIAEAAGLPVVVQHAPQGPGMDAAFLAHLFAEVPQIRYVKEEMEPSTHNISALLADKPPRCEGIFGGAFGRFMLSELRRGATGFMPGAECVEVHVAIWDAWQAGDEPAARALFNRLLPLINLNLSLSITQNKHLLQRRGAFAGTTCRFPGLPTMDAHDRHELDAIWADLSPLLRAE